MPNKLSGRAGFVVGDEYKRDGVQVGGGGWLVGGGRELEKGSRLQCVRACLAGGWWPLGLGKNWEGTNTS